MNATHFSTTRIQKFVAVLISFVMVATLCPQLAYAEGDGAVAKNNEPTGSSSACICEAACSEAAITQDCPVCGVEGADLDLCEGISIESAEAGGQVGGQDGATETDVAVVNLQAMINGLPSVEELASMSLEEQQKVYIQVQTAYDAYNALTDEQKDQITGEEVFDELFAVFNDLVNVLATANNVTYLDANGAQQTANNATIIESSTSTWNAGWYVVSDNVTISDRVTVTGDVYLILEDGCTLTAQAGIAVRQGNSLTIYGQQGSTGTVNATGGSGSAGIGGDTNGASGTITINGGTVNATGGDDGAGIGGGLRSSSIVTINGGTVNATGGQWGAGIGGGFNGQSGTIAINGGTVTATGGQGGSGIGGGCYGVGGTITINGGNVTANGSQGSQYFFCAGIGGGLEGSCDSVAINGGIVEAHGGHMGIGEGERATATCQVTVNGGVVTAIGDNDAGIGGTFFTGDSGNAVIITNAITDIDDTADWSGIIFQGSVGQVYGTNVNPADDFEVLKDYTLTIPTGVTLTIPTGVTLTNWGIISVEGSLINNGTIVNYGTITGTVSGDGIEKKPATVDLSDTNCVYGGSVTLTATVRNSSGTNATDGTVCFYRGTDTSGTPLNSGGTVVSNGTAEYTITNLDWPPNGSPYTITAVYTPGQSSGLLSGSGTATLTVAKATPNVAPNSDAMSSANVEETEIKLSSVIDSNTDTYGAIQYGYTTGNGSADDIDNWQDDTLFTGLQPGTDYTFYIRYKGNDLYNPSSPSNEGLTVTTCPDITTESLSDGRVGVNYEAQLSASVASGKNVTWKIEHGSLPAGLQLSGDTISGIPTAPGTFDIDVQATIYGGPNGEIPVQAMATLSITINQGTPAIAIISGSGTYTYGDTITITGSISASTTAFGANALAIPQNQVALFLGETQLTEPVSVENDNTFSISYDTSGQQIPIGNQTLTVRYGGSDTLTSGSTEVDITLAPKSVTAQVQGNITKIYDGNAGAEASLSVANSDLVNSADDIVVTGIGTYESVVVGMDIPVTVSDIQTSGTDAIWYSVSAPSNVTGSITPAASSVTTAPTAVAGLTYTGDAQALVTAGAAAGGTMVYALGADMITAPTGVYTSAIPQGVDAGAYYVWYKVQGDSNHYDSAPVCVTASIQRAVLATPQNLAWGGSYTATWDAVDNATGYSVQLYKDGISVGEPVEVTDTFCDLGDKIGEAGNYTFTVKATTTDTANYSCSQESGQSTTKPVIALNTGSYTSGEWTNKDVTLSVVAPSGATIQYKIGSESDTWQNYADAIIVSGDTDETKYSFRAVSADDVASEEVSVTVKLDKTAPSANITLAGVDATKALDEASYDQFYSEDVEVAVTSNDTNNAELSGSGVASTSYYRSNSETILSQGELEALPEDSWTVYEAPISEGARDADRFIYYVKVVDNAGNAAYVASCGVVFDMINPVISGIDNGATYYTTQQVQVSDTNLNTVTVNDGTGEAAVASNPFTLAGNTSATYTVNATDKAGNATSYSVSMQPIESLSSAIEGIEPNNVTTDHKETIEAYKQDLEELSQGAYATDEEKDTLQRLIDSAQVLLDRVDAAEQASNTANVQAVKDVSADNVTFEDKAILEAAKADLERALATYANGTVNNYTQEEKTQINEELIRIIGALDLLQSVEATQSAIEALPNSVAPDDTEAEGRVDAAQELYDNLSDHGKSLVSENALNKLESLQAQLVDYRIIEGSGASWSQGREEGLRFVANGAFTKFTGIQIDGNEVNEDSYSVESGSTIITLHAAYLDTLKEGEHTITVNYTDGRTEGIFTIEGVPAEPGASDSNNSFDSESEGADSSLTQTGDNNTVLTGALMLLAFGAVICALVSCRRIRK